ncbi:hypothetical protein YC2023_059155 [Brassica napus]
MCLRSSYPRSNDFGSEIITLAVKEHNVQVSLILCLAFHIIQYMYFLPDFNFILLARLFCSVTIGRILELYSFFDANLTLTEQVTLIYKNSLVTRVSEKSLLRCLCQKFLPPSSTFDFLIFFYLDIGVRTLFFTSPWFLPPTKVDKCRVRFLNVFTTVVSVDNNIHRS